MIYELHSPSIVETIGKRIYPQFHTHKDIMCTAMPHTRREKRTVHMPETSPKREGRRNLPQRRSYSSGYVPYTRPEGKCTSRNATQGQQYPSMSSAATLFDESLSMNYYDSMRNSTSTANNKLNDSHPHIMNTNNYVTFGPDSTCMHIGRIGKAHHFTENAVQRSGEERLQREEIRRRNRIEHQRKPMDGYTSMKHLQQGRRHAHPPSINYYSSATSSGQSSHNNSSYMIDSEASFMNASVASSIGGIHTYYPPAPILLSEHAIGASVGKFSHVPHVARNPNMSQHTPLW